jgi:hypothetical protein
MLAQMGGEAAGPSRLPEISIDADGSGAAVPIDDLTYASWSDGSFCWWQCGVWRDTPARYSGPSDI